MNILDDTNKIVLDKSEIMNVWQIYTAKHFEDNRTDVESSQNDPEGPEILKSKVLHASSIAKNRKASGPDGVPMELIKLTKEDNIGMVLRLFNQIYNSGELPEEWLRSTFITIPKKQHPKKCRLSSD